MRKYFVHTFVQVGSGGNILLKGSRNNQQNLHSANLIGRQIKANACQQTLGRAGAQGENRVRIVLHKRLGQSPDPEEVHNEMQRDKGFGRRKEQNHVSKKSTTLGETERKYYGNIIFLRQISI